MAFNLWAHQFCLACDKQVQVDGAAYCSESCRLADQEKSTSTPTSSQASSPAFAPAGYPWSSPSPSLPVRSSSSSSRPKFYLSPAYDFSNAQAYGAASPPRGLSLSSNHTASAAWEQSTCAYAANLTPSSSHSSLCSMQSTSTMDEPNQLSDNAKQELKAYAISFEHVRLQRRRSY
ncbi:uncharacterized protein MAM_00916 [Metarhizium album ARSEF 1941]|uniref:Life-span regulatory factor n=1 Tax=Metarhizium album (strain ARSEF 1941) TaxID=1081103 RepID=A0A0B2X8P9_METAS|nr:uncharacterized protein MAM_00916 [Metarhizium album ARSEF 1941]KHO01915.1 hypothetical protein MAM_00916 [Metarhizium album ARSEF 1941]